ncbi:MAG: NAAT family transporter [Lentisphaerae bacterium]|nr:NAAT family transporter [Lentisphaerota bacterium]MCP4100403.1 NAAT family transporter [Lentisphaerota bacterium]
MTEIIFTTFIKIFFLLTPFFLLSMFISITQHMSPGKQKTTAIKTSLAVFFICLVIYYFGEYIFKIMGITIDAFRIGSGVILLLTSIELVLGSGKGGPTLPDDDGEVAVVPLAIPYTLGPGTIGALLIMGGESHTVSYRVADSIGVLIASIALCILLLAATAIERIIRQRGMTILSKITGLVLASLAAQVFFTGARNLLFTAK